MKLHRRLSGMKIRRKNGLPCQVLRLPGILLSGIVILTLSACSSGSDTAGGDARTATNADEMVIAKALYFDKRTPDGFYKENLQDDTFYSISHVKNTSLLPVADRAGLTVHELASNDFSEALQWSDKAAQYQPSYSQLAANSETMLYYQFTRFNPDSPQFINMQRVFKATVLDRNGVDRNDDNARYRGRITMSKLTADKVKLIIEYLWMFTLSNNYQNAVLQSYTIETETEFVHIMKQARLKLNYSGACDDVEVYEVRYTIPKDSGFIWKDKSLTESFAAKRTDSYLEICK